MGKLSRNTVEEYYKGFCTGFPKTILHDTFDVPVKMIIQYRGGETYHAEGVHEVRVQKMKSGGHNITYKVTLDGSIPTSYGCEVLLGTRTFFIETEDVAVVLIENPHNGNLKESSLYEFAEVKYK